MLVQTRNVEVTVSNVDLFMINVRARNSRSAPSVVGGQIALLNEISGTGSTRNGGQKAALLAHFSCLLRVELEEESITPSL